MGGKVTEEIGLLEIRSSCSSWLLLLRSLRAPDCKYQKSYDRREISYFILFHLNVPFGELFSKKHN